MKWVVGIDGGGSRASAVVLDEDGNEAARTTGGSGIVEAPRIGQVSDRLAALVRTVLEQAGQVPPCDAAVFALAGAGREPQRSQVEERLAAAGVARVVAVVTDAEAAFHDALGEEPGILLIAGTGSIAWGRGGDGAEARTGGWGMRIGDEGSGYAIAIAGLRAVVRAIDGRDPETALTDGLLLEPGLNDPSALVRWADSAPKKEIAALAPIVLRVAESDPTALRIVEDAVDQLVRHVVTLEEKLRPWPDGAPVALAGGLVESAAPFRARLETAIADRVPGARVLDDVVDAARGAARLALRRLD
ncbi:MAG: BadF/BadG/BcrA/BcrD ATPase family protein [Gemmatimonadota bacterium]|jgi:glucosamine kinase